MLINNKVFAERYQIFPLGIGELPLDRTYLYISQGMSKSVLEEKGYILSFLLERARDIPT